MQTSVPPIYAIGNIGDIVGQPMLAHKAVHEAVHEAHVAAEVAAEVAHASCSDLPPVRR